MTTERLKIMVGDLEVDLVRKSIRHLNLTVYPPAGRVRVSAPLRMNDEAIRQAVLNRLPWIQRHQARFAAQERQVPYQYVTGECHYFLGEPYRLNVLYHHGHARVALGPDHTLDLVVREDSDAALRERVVMAWYRRQLKALIPPLIAQWESIIGVKAAEWGVKQMKTRWGTCNIKAQRIWLSLWLAKKPPRCLEYIVVHELMHLLVRHHGKRFIALMDRYLPNWRQCRAELKRAESPV